MVAVRLKTHPERLRCVRMTCIWIPRTFTRSIWTSTYPIIDAGAPYYGVKATASVGIASPYPAEANVNIDDADLTNFPLENLKDLSGHVTASIKATGSLSD